MKNFMRGKKQVGLKIHCIVRKAQISNTKQLRVQSREGGGGGLRGLDFFPSLTVSLTLYKYNKSSQGRRDLDICYIYATLFQTYVKT